MGKMFFNFLATFAEFEADLISLRTREGMDGRTPLQAFIGGLPPKETTTENLAA
jgi:DNA invertase Pin-like site-specific DNA recombinase